MKLFSSAIVLVSVMASMVSAHGRLVTPTALNTDFQTLNGNNICGRNVNLNGRTPSATFTAGATQVMSWFVLNGDGAGPIQVKIDPTGTGSSFTIDATITKQVPGEGGNIRNSGLRSNAAVDFEITVPNVVCAPQGCLMQVKQQQIGFGSCAFVNINGGSAPAPKAAPPPPAAKAPPPAPKAAPPPAPKAAPSPAPKQNNNQSNANNGQCSNVRQFGYIVQGNEHRFGFLPNSQVALNPAIVVDQICNPVPTGECKTLCQAAGAELIAKGVRGFSSAVPNVAKDIENAEAADAFNARLGNPSSIAATFRAGGAGANNNQGQNNNNNNQNQGQNNNNNNQGQNNNGSPTGSCQAADAQITVAKGADPTGNRINEVRAITTGRDRFGGQSSALNTGIVANFICDRLASDCGASQDIVSRCRAAQANLRGLPNNPQASDFAALGRAADAFNAVLGLRTTFEQSLVAESGLNGGANLVATPPPPPPLANVVAPGAGVNGNVNTANLADAIRIIQEAIDLLDTV
ncbi:hypothetical protein HDU67_005038 [Dinochytrium kinnereticum]|nr:hypothetical protein HDU67_005038 [Dinochytrium kinnereticum]